MNVKRSGQGALMSLAEWDQYAPIDTKVLLDPGDHIRVHRGGYDHHGIVIGLEGLRMWKGISGETVNAHKLGLSKYPVVHYAQGKGNGHLALTSLETFLDGKEEFEVLIHEDTGHLSKRQSVHRAMSHVGVGDYNLFKHNCEHFSTWCRTGHWASAQVTGVGAVVTLFGFAVGGWTVAFVPLAVTLGLTLSKPPMGACRRCPESHGWTDVAKGDKVALERVAGRLGRHERREVILGKRRLEPGPFTLYCVQHKTVRLTQVAGRSTTAWCNVCFEKMARKREARPMQPVSRV